LEPRHTPTNSTHTVKKNKAIKAPLRQKRRFVFYAAFVLVCCLIKSETVLPFCFAALLIAAFSAALQRTISHSSRFVFFILSSFDFAKLNVFTRLVAPFVIHKMLAGQQLPVAVFTT
jgi:hypothetical protein